EHDVDQLLEGHVGFVVVDAGAVAGALAAALALTLAFANDLAGLRFAVALADTRCIVTVDEAVLLDAADGNLDDALAILCDDRFLGDDIGDAFANRLAHLLPVPQAVTGRAITARGVGLAKWTEDGFGRGHGRRRQG